MTYNVGSIENMGHQTRFSTGDEVILRTSGRVMRVIGATKDASGKTWYALRRKRPQGTLAPRNNQADAYAHEEQLEPMVRM